MLPELESLGVATWLIQLSAPMGRLKERRELVLAPEELPALADWLVRARASSPVEIAVGDNIGYYSRWETSLRRRPDGNSLGFWCGCAAGCFTVGIEANGNVKGCLSLQSDEFVEGNLVQEDLRTIWERPGAFRYTREFTLSNLTGHCAGCAYGEVCRGGCTFMATAATGRAGDNPYCLHRLTEAL
jgi:radical SAM protein with 4Fe4S-binding SPASM domain